MVPLRGTEALVELARYFIIPRTVKTNPGMQSVPCPRSMRHSQTLGTEVTHKGIAHTVVPGNIPSLPDTAARLSRSDLANDHGQCTRVLSPGLVSEDDLASQP